MNKVNRTKIKNLFSGFSLLFTLTFCSSSNDAETKPIDPPITTSQVEYWLTTGNQKSKLEKQNTALTFNTVANTHPFITVDEAKTFQTIDGFGYTLTGGSAEVINQLTAVKKKELLEEIFGSADKSIGVSYIRLSIGASDLNATPFTYNDLAAGTTDLTLSKFSLAPDKEGVIALLKEILAINPTIKIIATPWTAPLWMKDKASFVGGSLQPKYYEVYANYFVKYIQQMKAEGITIDAITPQNEPLHGGNNPSMIMTAKEQADFIKNYLGPAFKTAAISTKIIAYDHNCDDIEYAKTILGDPATDAFVDGAAYHLYAGDISALSTIHDLFPTKNIYFTEQYTGSEGNFAGDLKWHLKNVIIGSMRNWSKIALEWNLANDTNFGPHTQGGCDTCKGALTIKSNDSFERNVAYYIIAHASKFVPAGSIRIESNIAGDLHNVAFLTPSGKKVLIVANDGSRYQTFNIKNNGKWITSTLDAGSVATFSW